MRNQIFSVTAALALAAVVTTSAMAFDHKTGHGAGHVKRFYPRGMNESRFGGTPYQGGYRDLDPLGVQFPCAPHGYCGQGYSVSAWSW